MKEICLQWLVCQNSLGNLPFLATSFGRWWGGDPAKREQADIDAIAANRQERSIALGECKWRNAFDESAALSALEARARLVRGFERRAFFLFTKRPASAGTQRKVADLSPFLLVFEYDERSDTVRVPAHQQLVVYEAFHVSAAVADRQLYSNAIPMVARQSVWRRFTRRFVEIDAELGE